MSSSWQRCWARAIDRFCRPVSYKGQAQVCQIRPEISDWSEVDRGRSDLPPPHSIFFILYSSHSVPVFGIIFLWRVLPEKRAEHAEVMQAVLQAERERCPEVLANLTFGPADDGTCGEV